MFRSIVVGTDGSDTASKAVATAVGVASEQGASLHVVSAFVPVARQRLDRERRDAPPEVGWSINPREDVDATLAGAREQAEGAGIEVRTYAREGDAADAILDVAEEIEADLV